MFLQKYIHLYISAIFFIIAISLVTPSPVTIVVKREIEVIVEVVTCTVTVTVTAFDIPPSSAIDENPRYQAILPLQDSDVAQDPQDFLKFNGSGEGVTPLANLVEDDVLDDTESSILQDVTPKNITLDSSATSKSSDNQDAANTSNFPADSKPPVIKDFSKVPESPTFNEVPKKQEAPAFINVPKVPEDIAFNEFPKAPEVLASPKSTIKNKSPEIENFDPVASDNSNDQELGSSKFSPSQHTPKIQDTPKDQDREKTPDPTLKDQDREKTLDPTLKDQDREKSPDPTLKDQDREKSPDPTLKDQDREKTPDPTLKDQDREKTLDPTLKDQDREKTPDPTLKDQDREKTLDPTPKDQDREKTPDSTSEKKKPGSSKVLSDYEAATIERHNAHRFNHSSIELTWNKTLASFALETAKTCVFAHDLTPGDGNYGQNIAAFGSSKGVKFLDKSTLIADAVSNKWYNSELKFVPFGIPRPSTSGPEFLHLTQIIWKETKSVGCVTIECPGGSIFSIPSLYTVCNYFPAGNIMGRFDKQVSRPLGQKTIAATIA